MNKTNYKKSEIITCQLKSAIKLFDEEDYVSALTLSGAAYELTYRMCQLNKLPWKIKIPKENLEGLKKQKSDGIEKYLKILLNKTKNELKHHDTFEDSIVVADFYFETEMFILSSIDNFKILFGQFPKEQIILNFMERLGEPNERK